MVMNLWRDGGKKGMEEQETGWKKKREGGWGGEGKKGGKGREDEGREKKWRKELFGGHLPYT